MKGKSDIENWALCYDELEIAPDWLIKELFGALRSLEEPNIFLKLTCSPILPTGLESGPRTKQDFTAIRLWDSHIPDAKSFCEDFTSNFLENKFSKEGISVTPDEFFSCATFAEEEEDSKSKVSYDRNSPIFRVMKELVKHDESFKKLLIDNKIDHTDPFTESIEIRDKLFRKIKPIVLLRKAFLKDSMNKLRSRKTTTVLKGKDQIAIYSGKDSVYAMSEGNPRWLMGLLTDMYDGWTLKREFSKKENKPFVSPDIQARGLLSTSCRFDAFLSATVTHGEKGSRQHVNTITLQKFTKDIGNALKSNILTHEFPLDPVGSFVIDTNTARTLNNIIDKAIEVGAIIHIGKPYNDVTEKIIGERFRLTFMLAPIYRLPFRNYASIDLSSLLSKKKASDLQMKLLLEGKDIPEI